MILCCAVPSLITIGALGVADAECRSLGELVICVDEVMAGYPDFGLASWSGRGGASGAAAADATAVDMISLVADYV